MNEISRILAFNYEIMRPRVNSAHKMIFVAALRSWLSLSTVVFPVSLPRMDHKFTPDGNDEQFVPPRNRHGDGAEEDGAL